MRLSDGRAGRAAHRRGVLGVRKRPMQGVNAAGISLFTSIATDRRSYLTAFWRLPDGLSLPASFPNLPKAGRFLVKPGVLELGYP